MNNSLFTPEGACEAVKKTKYAHRFEELQECVYSVFGMACAESEDDNDNSSDANLRKALYIFMYGYLAGLEDAKGDRS